MFQIIWPNGFSGWRQQTLGPSRIRVETKPAAGAGADTASCGVEGLGPKQQEPEEPDTGVWLQ